MQYEQVNLKSILPPETHISRWHQGNMDKPASETWNIFFSLKEKQVFGIKAIWTKPTSASWNIFYHLKDKKVVDIKAIWIQVNKCILKVILPAKRHITPSTTTNGFWVNMHFLLAYLLVLLAACRTVESNVTHVPLLCPAVTCDGAQCRHLERSGMCEEVVKGHLEVTQQNCGCCFLCKGKTTGEYMTIWKPKPHTNQDRHFLANVII